MTEPLYQDHPYVRAVRSLHARLDAAIQAGGGLGDLGELAQILDDRAESAAVVDGLDPDWVRWLLDRRPLRSGSLRGGTWIAHKGRLLPPPDLDEGLLPQRGRNGLPRFPAVLWVLVDVGDPEKGLWLRSLEPDFTVSTLLRLWMLRTYPRVQLLFRAEEDSDDFNVEAVLLPTDRSGGPPVLILGTRAWAAASSQIPELRDRQGDLSLLESDLDLIDIVARGHTTKVAAAMLGVCAKTLESRRKRIAEKTGAQGRPGITELATQIGVGPGYPPRVPALGSQAERSAERGHLHSRPAEPSSEVSGSGRERGDGA